MRLFCDEDVGRGVPEALRNVGLPATYVRREFRRQLQTRPSIPDEEWLRYAGRGQLLILSCNTGILDAQAQRRVLIDERVGAVFLTTGKERSVDVLKLLLRKWDWLESVDRSVERPFAFRLPLSGHPIRRDPRV